MEFDTSVCHWNVLNVASIHCMTWQLILYKLLLRFYFHSLKNEVGMAESMKNKNQKFALQKVRANGIHPGVEGRRAVTYHAFYSPLAFCCLSGTSMFRSPCNCFLGGSLSLNTASLSQHLLPTFPNLIISAIYSACHLCFPALHTDGRPRGSFTAPA